VGEVKVKLVGTGDDLKVFLDVLYRLFNGRVLASPMRPNEREPGYHLFASAFMADLTPEFQPVKKEARR
jgi:hypothetical protein